MEAEEAQLEAVKALPSLEGKKGTWHLYIHKLRCWLPRELSEEEAAKAGDGEAAEEVVRPFLLLVYDSEGNILSCEPPKVEGEADTKASGQNLLCTGEDPSLEKVIDFLFQVMQRPKLIFVGPDAAKYKPGRPTRIQMADTLTAHLHREAAAYIDLQSGALPKEWEEESACEYVGACAPILEKVGIGCTFAPVPHHLIQLLVRQQIEPNLRRRAIQAGVAEEVAANPIAHLPPVLVDGIPLEFATHLFDVTAALHDSNVWTSLPPNVAYKVSYVLVRTMGKDGQEKRLRAQGYGVLASNEETGEKVLELHRTEEQALMALKVSVAPESEQQGVDGVRCLFVSPLDCPFEDLDDIDRYGWALGTPTAQALPLLCQMKMSEEENSMNVTRPGLLDYQWLEVACQALVATQPQVEQHVQSQEKGGKVQGASFDVEVITRASKGALEQITATVEICDLLNNNPDESSKSDK